MTQIAATVIFTAALCYLMAQGVSAPLPLVIVSAAACCYVVIACGRIALRALAANDLPLAAVWPLGVTLTSIGLWALVMLLGVSAAAAFALWGAAVVLADVATRRRTREPAPTYVDLIGVVLCCAFSAAWCKDLAAAPAALAERGVLTAWVDYFIHGGVIAQFGDPRALNRGTIWLVDFPRQFYHYAAFLLPAAFAAPLEEAGLALATSVLAPIGMLVLAGAAYTLGAALAGTAGGVAALVAVFAIPDASNYWMRNGFYSFHWNLLTLPGATYAIGAALLAVVFLKRWSETGARSALLASAALVSATFLFRAHIFLLLFPAWLTVVAIASPMVRRKWLHFLAGGALVAVAAIVAYQYSMQLPAGDSWTADDGRAMKRFLEQVHQQQEPTAYTGLYASVLDEHGEAIGSAFGILLVYPVAFGAFLLLLPMALWLQRRTIVLHGIDALPLAMLVLFAPLMAFAPIPAHSLAALPAHFDATELVHRPFVLLYALLAIWSGALGIRAVSGPEATRSSHLWAGTAIVAALTLPVIWWNAANLARPKFDWGGHLNAYAVDRDVVAAAAFVRARSRIGDVVATGAPSGGYSPMDVPSVIVALTSTPSYLARAWYQVSIGGGRRALALRRYGELRSIDQAPQREAAFDGLRRIGVRWYVTATPGTPVWDPQRRLASHARGNVAVYEIPP